MNSFLRNIKNLYNKKVIFFIFWVKRPWKYLTCKTTLEKFLSWDLKKNLVGERTIEKKFWTRGLKNRAQFLVEWLNVGERLSVPLQNLVTFPRFFLSPHKVLFDYWHAFMNENKTFTVLLSLNSPLVWIKKIKKYSLSSIRRWCVQRHVLAKPKRFRYPLRIISWWYS